MKRPSLMWSIVRAMSASRFGLRYELHVTSAPMRACRRVGGHRREQRVGLEVLRLGIAVQRVEVVPHPDAVDAQPVGGAPRGAQRVDRRGLRMELHTDLEPSHGRQATDSRRLVDDDS